MGIIDISFQKTAGGKCATPTTHLIIQCYFNSNIQGCLESMDWTTGLEYWTGILKWPKPQ